MFGLRDLLHVGGEEAVLLYYTDLPVEYRLGVHAFMLFTHNLQTGGDLDNVDLMANSGWLAATSGLVYWLTGDMRAAAMTGIVNFGGMYAGYYLLGNAATRGQPPIYNGL